MRVGPARALVTITQISEVLALKSTVAQGREKKTHPVVTRAEFNNRPFVEVGTQGQLAPVFEGVASVQRRSTDTRWMHRAGQ